MATWRSSDASPRGEPSRQGGFTLIEVLVALVFVAISSFAVLKAQNSGIATEDFARRLNTATFLARDLLVQLETAEEVPVNGEGNGDFGVDYPGYSWVWFVDQGPVKGIKVVTVKVLYGMEGRTVDVTTYILRQNF